MEGLPLAAFREIRTLQRIAHENVVHLHEAILQNDTVYLVFEFMPYDLSGILSKVAQGQLLLRETHIRRWARDLLSGVAFLHAAGMMHRDIKSANLLIDAQGRLKLGDLGLSRSFCHAALPGSPPPPNPPALVGTGPSSGPTTRARPNGKRSRGDGAPPAAPTPVDEEEEEGEASEEGAIPDLSPPPAAKRPRCPVSFTSRVVTLGYRPPELLLGCIDYGPEIDLWSVGCVLAEMYFALPEPLRRSADGSRGPGTPEPEHPDRDDAFAAPTTPRDMWSPLPGDRTLPIAQQGVAGPFFRGETELAVLFAIWKRCGVPTAEGWPELRDLPYWGMMPRPRAGDTHPGTLATELSQIGISSVAQELIQALLVPAPARRLTACQALVHPFFRGPIAPQEDMPLPTEEVRYQDLKQSSRRRGP
ncbi:CMGC/CDK protein kinase [Fonticula alba]|uniref:CMGC/CDK protein kinase n=1 Tax=Fonticula alba TaxID=691883 RepID=A0A058Z4G1_FONAL|nr:CMGC/CDK protein kinase [Fonticula alba]KCV68986.1 CMGC/CDK protein kinase [Fonticula alba]|eukprot:XP_009496557.1 CMGC/CDK protein kinase [Fonticula alba]